MTGVQTCALPILHQIRIDAGVDANLVYLQLDQPLPEEMQDGKEINDHKQAIDDQFRDESLQRLTNLLFAWSGHVTSHSRRGRPLTGGPAAAAKRHCAKFDSF